MALAGLAGGGQVVSIVSKLAIRYEGRLHGIDTQKNTVTLHDVRVLGTEDRVTGEGSVPPSSNVYQYVELRGCDIQDLTVYEASKAQGPAAAVRERPPYEGEKRHDSPPPPRGDRGKGATTSPPRAQSSAPASASGQWPPTLSKKAPDAPSRSTPSYSEGKGRKGGEERDRGKGSSERSP
eukprot:Hpha_TRINITY_DN6140_c0_g1::TRINITY_DN6140_c0_g1_i1::g.164865::m.164865/K18749/LSM14, RAP55, SCD6; protein LSM14